MLPHSGAKKVIFFGTPEFSCPALRALIASPLVQVAAVVTQPDKPAGRGKEVQQPAVKSLSAAHGIVVLQPTSLRKERDAFLAQATELGPFELGVVIAFGQILPQHVLDLPRRGCINIHASLLPRWRGAAPIQRAIMAGDQKTGITLMHMDAGLDTGPMLARAEVPISERETGGSLHDVLAKRGAELLALSLPELLSGTLQPERQPEQGVTYADKIRSDECKIDWGRPALDIERHVRALSPFPAAFTLLDGKRLKILMASARAEPHTSRPGELLRQSLAEIAVACGSGSLVIEELQLEGRKRMLAAEFVKGYRFESAAVFS